MEELIPWLYLKGISTGDFAEVLVALVGKDAPRLSASTISRLKTVWQEDLEQWQKRDLSHKRYVSIWIDGKYGRFIFKLRPSRQSMDFFGTIIMRRENKDEVRPGKTI